MTGVKRIVTTSISAVAVIACVAAVFLMNRITPAVDYENAVRLMDTGEYARAAEVFEALGDYKDSEEMVSFCNYRIAGELFSSGKYGEALEAFRLLGGYEDSGEMVLKCRYKSAEEKLNSGDTEAALAEFEALGDYEDSAERILEYKYHHALELFNAGDREQAVFELAELNNYRYCDGIIYSYFTNLSDYEDISPLLYNYARKSCLSNKSASEWMMVKLGLHSVVSAASRHTVGIAVDGTVLATGKNDDGQCDVYSWEDIVSVSAGFSNTVGLRSDGTVVATGSNQYGEGNVSSWRNIVSISAGGWGHTVGLRSDGIGG